MAHVVAQAATVDEQRHVLDEERVGLLAEPTAVQQQQVPEEPVDDEGHRHDEPPRFVRGEGVRRVRADRRRRHDPEQLVDEPRRVAREHRACAGALERELRPPLAEREKQREQERAEEEPLRDPHVDRDRPGRCPQHEEPGDRDHVDELDRLQAERVGRLQREKPGHARERAVARGWRRGRARAR